jgi:hypothetical protein
MYTGELHRQLSSVFSVRPSVLYDRIPSRHHGSSICGRCTTSSGMHQCPGFVSSWDRDVLRLDDYPYALFFNAPTGLTPSAEREPLLITAVPQTVSEAQQQEQTPHVTLRCQGFNQLTSMDMHIVGVGMQLALLLWERVYRPLLSKWWFRQDVTTLKWFIVVSVGKMCNETECNNYRAIILSPS